MCKNYIWDQNRFRCPIHKYRSGTENCEVAVVELQNVLVAPTAIPKRALE